MQLASHLAQLFRSVMAKRMNHSKQINHTMEDLILLKLEVMKPAHKAIRKGIIAMQNEFEEKTNIARSFKARWEISSFLNYSFEGGWGKIVVIRINLFIHVNNVNCIFESKYFLLKVVFSSFTLSSI